MIVVTKPRLLRLTMFSRDVEASRLPDILVRKRIAVALNVSPYSVSLEQTSCF